LYPQPFHFNTSCLKNKARKYIQNYRQTCKQICRQKNKMDQVCQHQNIRVYWLPHLHHIQEAPRWNFGLILTDTFHGFIQLLYFVTSHHCFLPHVTIHNVLANCHSSDIPSYKATFVHQDTNWLQKLTKDHLTEL
jgi:hypothetical protein